MKKTSTGRWIAKPFLPGDDPYLTRDEAHDRVSATGAAERLASFGKRHKLSLGEARIRDVVNKGHR